MIDQWDPLDVGSGWPANGEPLNHVISNVQGCMLLHLAFFQVFQSQHGPGLYLMKLHILLAQSWEFVFVYTGSFDWFWNMSQFFAMSYQNTMRSLFSCYAVSGLTWAASPDCWRCQIAGHVSRSLPGVMIIQQVTDASIQWSWVGYGHDNNLCTQKEMQTEFLYGPQNVYKESSICSDSMHCRALVKKKNLVIASCFQK